MQAQVLSGAQKAVQHSSNEKQGCAFSWQQKKTPSLAAIEVGMQAPPGQQLWLLPEQRLSSPGGTQAQLPLVQTPQH